MRRFDHLLLATSLLALACAITSANPDLPSTSPTTAAVPGAEVHQYPAFPTFGIGRDDPDAILLGSSRKLLRPETQPTGPVPLAEAGPDAEEMSARFDRFAKLAPELASWKRLRRVVINFADAELSDVQCLRALERVPNLEEIELHNVWAHTGRLVALLEGVPRLRALTLDGELDDQSLDGLDRLVTLEGLRIAATGDPQFFTIDRSASQFSALKKLEVLDLKTPRVDRRALEAIASLRSLRILTVDAGVAAADIGTLGKCTQLRHLGLPRILNEPADWSFLPSLTELKYLQVYPRTALDRKSLESIAKLRNLRYLALFGCAVGDADFTPLSGLPRLEVLHLLGSDIGEDALRSLAGCTALRWISLGFHVAHSDGARELQEKLPGMRIYAE